MRVSTLEKGENGVQWGTKLVWNQNLPQILMPPYTVDREKVLTNCIFICSGWSMPGWEITWETYVHLFEFHGRKAGHYWNEMKSLPFALMKSQQPFFHPTTSVTQTKLSTQEWLGENHFILPVRNMVSSCVPAILKQGSYSEARRRGKELISALGKLISMINRATLLLNEESSQWAQRNLVAGCSTCHSISSIYSHWS